MTDGKPATLAPNVEKLNIDNSDARLQNYMTIEDRRRSDMCSRDALDDDLRSLDERSYYLNDDDMPHLRRADVMSDDDSRRVRGHSPAAGGSPV